MIHLIKRFGIAVEVTRNCGDLKIVDGYFIPTKNASKFSIEASVQPMTAEDLEQLPEGSDTKESLKLYAIVKLFPRQGNPSLKGDFFCVNGNKYEVVSVEDHTSHNTMNIFYYKIIGVKVAYDS